MCIGCGKPKTSYIPKLAPPNQTHRGKSNHFQDIRQSIICSVEAVLTCCDLVCILQSDPYLAMYTCASSPTHVYTHMCVCAFRCISTQGFVSQWSDQRTHVETQVPSLVLRGGRRILARTWKFLSRGGLLCRMRCSGRKCWISSSRTQNIGTRKHVTLSYASFQLTRLCVYMCAFIRLQVYIRGV